MVKRIQIFNMVTYIHTLRAMLTLLRYTRIHDGRFHALTVFSKLYKKVLIIPYQISNSYYHSHFGAQMFYITIIIVYFIINFQFYFLYYCVSDTHALQSRRTNINLKLSEKCVRPI